MTEQNGIDVLAIRRDAEARVGLTGPLVVSSASLGVVAGALVGWTHVQAMVAIVIFVSAIASVFLREFGEDHPHWARRIVLATCFTGGGAVGCLIQGLVHAFLSAH